MAEYLKEMKDLVEFKIDKARNDTDQFVKDAMKHISNMKVNKIRS